MEKLAEMPVFICNEEELRLDEIQKRKINSVTVAYLSEPIKVRAPGFSGMLGKKIIKQENKELTITDEKGIALYFNLGHTTVSVRFWEEAEWEKIRDYDEETIYKSYVMTLLLPYQINFHISNLKSISWT